MLKTFFFLVFLIFNSTAILSFTEVKESDFNTATRGQFPFTTPVVIQWNYDTRRCVGALIDVNWVISAASCLYQMPRIQAHILLGVAKYDRNEDSEQIINAKTILQHPQYSDTTFENDLVLFELEKSAVIDEFTQVIVMNSNSTLDDNFLTVMGWNVSKGYTDTNFHSADLLYSTLSVVPNDICAEDYFFSIKPITDKILCAQSSSPKCLIDPGSPAVQYINETPILFGIATSNMVEDHTSCIATPMKFTKISEYQDWIQSVISNNKPKVY